MRNKYNNFDNPDGGFQGKLNLQFRKLYTITILVYIILRNRFKGFICYI